MYRMKETFGWIENLLWDSKSVKSKVKRTKKSLARTGFTSEVTSFNPVLAKIFLSLFFSVIIVLHNCLLHPVSFLCLFTRKILKVNFVVINGRASFNVWTKAFLIPYCCLMQFIRLLCLTVYKVSSMKVPWYLEFLYRDKVTNHLYSIDLHFYSVWLQDAEVALSPRNKVLI